MEDELLKIDGCDAALIGSASVWQGNHRVETYIYDGQKLIEVFMDQGMKEHEALEWIEYNIEGAYVGPATPIIMWPHYE
jgi:hypothetical protein